MLTNKLPLEQQNDILKAALQFYANPKNWVKLVTLPDDTEWYTDKAATYNDLGVTARITLSIILGDNQ